MKRINWLRVIEAVVAAATAFLGALGGSMMQ